MDRWKSHPSPRHRAQPLHQRAGSPGCPAQGEVSPGCPARRGSRLAARPSGGLARLPGPGGSRQAAVRAPPQAPRSPGPRWTKKNLRTGNPVRRFEENPGDVLLSHQVTLAVPSAPRSLTSEFGMGSGVASLTSSPETCGCVPRTEPCGAVFSSRSTQDQLCHAARHPSSGRDASMFALEVWSSRTTY